MDFPKSFRFYDRISFSDSTTQMGWLLNTDVVEMLHLRMVLTSHVIGPALRIISRAGGQKGSNEIARTNCSRIRAEDANNFWSSTSLMSSRSLAVDLAMLEVISRSFCWLELNLLELLAIWLKNSNM